MNNLTTVQELSRTLGNFQGQQYHFEGSWTFPFLIANFKKSPLSIICFQSVPLEKMFPAIPQLNNGNFICFKSVSF